MFCPECGAEYREGFDRCAECDVALAAEGPPAENHEAPNYVTVFETSEVDVIPVIKSILRGAEIPFQTGGEAIMNLFPSDMLGQIMGKPSNEIRFSVPEDRAEEARQLLTIQPLESLQNAADESEAEDDES